MSWNYRIFKHRTRGHITYALHEAYYNSKGKVDGWTINPMSEHRDSVDDLMEMLAIQLRDAIRSRKDIIEFNQKKKKGKK